MKSSKYTPSLGIAGLLMMVAMAFTLAACDSSALPEADYTAPLSLSGVHYVSPDSMENPEVIRPGGTITIQGENMNSVVHLYINGLEVEFNPALVTEEHLIVTVPADMPFAELDPNAESFGTIKVTNESSEAVLEFPVLPPAPVVASISNEYAEPGEEVTIYGQFLYAVDTITLPDGTTIPGSAVTAEPDGSAITFTIPEEATEQPGAIEVTTASGTDLSTPAFAFHETDGILFNADDYSNWGGWNAVLSANAENQELISGFRYGAEGEFAVLKGDGAIGPNNNAWYGANRVLNLASQQWVAPENLDEPAGNFAVKFELNIRQEWDAGTLQIYLLETASDSYETGYAYLVKPWEQPDGSVSPVFWEGWRTITVPLSEFSTAMGTSDDTATSLAALFGSDGAVSGGGPDGNPTSIRLVNYTDREVAADQAFAIDNLRVVRIAGAAE